MRWVLVPLLFGCSSLQTPRPPAPGHRALRVVTYNVNYGIPGDAPTLKALAAADGDVVLLQETNPGWEAAIGDLYPHRRFEHRGAAGGIAVLSKHPILQVEILEPPVKGSWFCSMRVHVDVGGTEVQLLNVHLRPQVSDGGSVVKGYFSTPKIRRAEMRAYLERLAPDVPTVVAGDFNESGSGAATSHLEERGFADAVPIFKGSEPTWRWPTSVGNITSTLDRVMVKGLTPIDADVLQAGRSDHLPVVTVLELPPE